MGEKADPFRGSMDEAGNFVVVVAGTELEAGNTNGN